MTDYAGIDYSLGQSNVNRDTGIHYGVISQHSVMPEALSDMEPDYGQPSCPVCGNEVQETAKVTEQIENGVSIRSVDEREYEQYSNYGCSDYACDGCKLFFDSSEVYGDEPLGFTYEQDGYKLADCLNSDIFVLESPFYTFAQFCSPCVPGAGNLDTACSNGPKTYCLGHDWFEDGKAPYPVYRVEDGTLVTE